MYGMMPGVTEVYTPKNTPTGGVRADLKTVIVKVGCTLSVTTMATTSQTTQLPCHCTRKQ